MAVRRLAAASPARAHPDRLVDRRLAHGRRLPGRPGRAPSNAWATCTRASATPAQAVAAGNRRGLPEPAAEFIGGHEDEILNHPHHRLHLLTVRGMRAPGCAGAPRAPKCAASPPPSLLNLASRDRLAHMLERVVIGDARDSAPWLRESFDAFTTHFATLDAGNLAAALLASGTLPLIMQPVRGIAGAPRGHVLGRRHHRLPPGAAVLAAGAAGRTTLVLYPHFTEHIVPGWLDKALPWRRAARGRQPRLARQRDHRRAVAANSCARCRAASCRTARTSSTTASTTTSASATGKSAISRRAAPARRIGRIRGAARPVARQADLKRSGAVKLRTPAFCG